MNTQVLVLNDDSTFSNINGSIMEWDELTEEDEDSLDNGCIPETPPSRKVCVEELLREAIDANLPCVKGWKL
jgi:hypothetical protein